MKPKFVTLFALLSATAAFAQDQAMVPDPVGPKAKVTLTSSEVSDNNTPLTPTDDEQQEDDQPIFLVGEPRPKAPKAPEEKKNENKPRSIQLIRDAQNPERPWTIGGYVHGGILNGPKAIAGGGGLGLTAQGPLFKSRYDSGGRLELLMGAPVVRLNATGEIFPVHITEKTWSDIGGNAHQLNLKFVTSSRAQLSIDTPEIKNKNNTIGNSNITVSPELAVQWFNASHESGRLLKLEARAGAAGGAAHDKDGDKAIAGPTAALSASIVFNISDDQHITLSVGGRTIASMVKGMAHVFGGEAGIEYSNDIHPGQQGFIGAGTVIDTYDVAPKDNGPNSSNGISAYAGLKAGLRFQ